MTKVFIGLGSNLGDGRKNLIAGWNRLGQIEGILLGVLSCPYFTEPQDIATDKWFTNAVGILGTVLDPEALLAALLGIEKEFGRDRQLGRDRTLDLDLLYYDNVIIKTSSLIVPHPYLARRRFVLEPLHEIAPFFKHPVSGETTAQMLARLNEQRGQNAPSVVRLGWEEIEGKR